jgi:hypothetical protein
MPIPIASAVLALVDWKKVLKNVATEAADKGGKNLLSRLKLDEQEKSSRHMVELFVEQFVKELEDKSILSLSVERYREQLKQFLESAAPDIAAYLQPDTKEIDLRQSSACGRNWASSPSLQTSTGNRWRRILLETSAAT